jgi:hypothetical protein
MEEREVMRFGYAVGAAFVIMVGLGAVLLIGMLLGRGKDAIEDGETESEAAAVDCQYSGVDEAITLYAAPFGAPRQQQGTLPFAQEYKVVKQHGDFYLVEIPDADPGWVYGPQGTLKGACDDIPQDDTPLNEFPTICTLQLAEESTVYGEPDLVNAVGTVAAGQYVVEGIQGDLYLLWVDPTLTGWVTQLGGQLFGACDALVAPTQ